MRPRHRLSALLGLLLALPAAARAQELSVLDPLQARWILQEVSGDAAFEHVRFMSAFHRPGGGHDNLWTVAQYHADKAEDFGLQRVALLEQPFQAPPWKATHATCLRRSRTGGHHAAP